MTTSLVFGGGLATSYLNNPLRKQLLELCGTAERVAFWAAFANVTVVLMPAIFAMSVEPGAGASTPPLLAIAQQLKWGFIGLVTSVLTMGWILSRFIPRASGISPSTQSQKR